MSRVNLIAISYSLASPVSITARIFGENHLEGLYVLPHAIASSLAGDHAANIIVHLEGSDVCFLSIALLLAALMFSWYV